MPIGIRTGIVCFLFIHFMVFQKAFSGPLRTGSSSLDAVFGPNSGQQFT